ncbi:MAG: WG repeat-containing protein [Bacteriodetes bacterium]|nr:WG repeat-containing protein [Bacteroidota bacterium]
MKNLGIILLTLTLISCMGQIKQAKPGEPLFLISDHNKFGFIDSIGQVVVEPKFIVLGEITEGLAHARISGTYGYINYTGEFIIQPQYDYATPFADGLAIVYKRGKPFFINKLGQKAFECNFHLLGQFNNGRAVVKTTTEKFGVINKRGELIIDTVYSRLKSIPDGMFIVQGINHHPYTDKEKGITNYSEMGVIDSLGNFIIPYGKFIDITRYDNGYFLATTPEEPWNSIDGYTGRTVILDKTGRAILSKDHRNQCYLEGTLHCGLAKMHLYKYWIPEKRGVYSSSENSYQGYMNTKGEIIINDTTLEAVKDFSDGRAFVKNKNGHYSILNTHGKFVAKNSFNNVLGNGFYNGVAFVAVNQKWGLIDTNAHFIINPLFYRINDIGMIDDYFFFEEPNPDTNNPYNNLTGIASKNGKILVKPIIERFDQEGFRNGLLKCIIDKKLTYITINGKIVWQEITNESKELSNLNIDYMNRGHFYAYSLPKENVQSGGWAESQNIPKKMYSSSDFIENSVSVVVKPATSNTFSTPYNVLAVCVANNTKSNIQFNAQDSRLYMKVQALINNDDNKDTWVDIEYLPSSWCGNSYHTLTLEPRYYWTFTTPIYDGDYKTRLRIELKYIDPLDHSEKRRDEKEITIYSNEYIGSINPGQLWRKQDYYPNGIMDPYND